MGGQNPYIAEAEYTAATTKYKLTILHEGKEDVIEVDPAKIPYGDHGVPGSILDIAMGHKIGLDHACGAPGPRQPANFSRRLPFYRRTNTLEFN